MDVETLFYIAAIAIYFLFQILGGKKKRQAKKQLPIPTQGQEQATSTGEPTLDDALREIRQALGMEPPPARPPQPSAPQSKPHPVREHGPELMDLAPKRPWPSEFQEIKTHYADEAFEAARDGDRFGKPRTTSKRSTHPALRTTVQKPPFDEPFGGHSKPDMKRLDIKTVREAFILSELLGPPRALRR